MSTATAAHKKEGTMSTAKALKVEAGVSLLQRPLYSAGLLLEDEDLNAGVAYTREVVRLLFRSLFGCGVVCGLKVEAQRTCEGRKLEVTVREGLALDAAGNPIHVTKPVVITYDPDCEPLPPSVWVEVCYREKPCRPRDVSCSPDADSGKAPTRSRDGFEVRLRDHQPECACSCEEPRPQGERPHGRCCQDETTPASSSSSARVESAGGKAEHPGGAEHHDPCECYRDHNDGVCASCGCGCCCVVLARVDLDPWKVDNDIRRSIRPVLTGYLHCKERADEASRQQAKEAADRQMLQMREQLRQQLLERLNQPQGGAWDDAAVPAPAASKPAAQPGTFKGKPPKKVS